MNGRVTSISARWASTGLPDFLGTAVLFHHNGLPRTPFYTQKYLKGALEAVGVPLFVSANLANYRYKFSPRLKSALEQSGSFLPLSEAHLRFGNELTKALNVVLPEYSPFKIYFTYYYEENSTENVVSEISKNGTDRLISAPIAPFESPHSRELREKKILKLLHERNREIRDINTGNISFVGKRRPVSFDFQQVNSIGEHECLVRYYAEKISQSANSSDSLVFAAPLPHPINYFSYSKSVHSTSKRIAYALYEKYPRALPFRVAFYPSWDYVIPFPSLSSINAQLKDLRKFGYRNPMVVPLGSLFSDFDTQTIIPRILGKTDVQLLRPQVQEKSLIHSMTELVKTQLLTHKLVIEKSGADPLF